MNILNKLLTENTNRGQIISAVVGSFLGLLLLLLSIQFYMDLKKLTSSEGGEGEQFVTINKQVTFERAVFSDEEIENIENQPFINKIGRYSSNQYRLGISSSLLGFYTLAFFESIPDEFIDIDVPEYKWAEGDKIVPIIVSKDYLTLYNFGFAPSQGFPQFKAEALSTLILTIHVQGQGKKRDFKGKVVGLSERINSVLVPQSFMEYTNSNFKDSEAKGSSRILVAADNPYSDQFKNFLLDNNYELSTGKLIGGELASGIQSIVTTVAIIGFLIVLLSVLIFILNYQLIVSKASRDIGLMLQLGYKQNQISDILKKQLLRLFGVVMGLTALFFVIIRFGIVKWFSTQGLNLDFIHWIVILAAILFTAIFIFINFSNIKKSVQNLSS